MTLKLETKHLEQANDNGDLVGPVPPTLHHYLTLRTEHESGSVIQHFSFSGVLSSLT
jgi:hypothetical protein